MESKTINVKLGHGFGRESLDKDFFPIRILRENFNVKFVDSSEEADVIFELVSRASNYSFLREKNKKTILISSEDLFFKRNIFNIIESFLNKIFRNRKYVVMNKIDSILPKFISAFPLFYFLPKHLKFIKKISRGEVKNAYAIIQNDIPSKNIFVIPYFLNLFYYRMPDLIKNTRSKQSPRKNFCAFIVSSNSSRERVQFFKRLSQYKRVDSYGRVMNNMGDLIFKKEWYDTHNDIFKKYKFIICFENNFNKYYMTEKLPNAMFANSIPVYRGASNVGDFFNTNSFINYGDYKSYKKMIDKIIELDKNSEEYEKMRNQPWFKNNKIPEIIKSKEKELVEFYRRVFSS